MDECLDQYGGLVWSLARRLSPGRDEAEDGVQEVFIDLWRHAGRFDPERASEATFVATIARRRLIDRHRRAGRTIRSAPIEAASGAPAPPGGDAAERSEEVERVREKLEELRPEEREVLRLAVLEGVSHSAIAARLGLPLGTVKTRARRGLLRLRDLLAVDPPRTSAEGGAR